MRPRDCQGTGGSHRLYDMPHSALPWYTPRQGKPAHTHRHTHGTDPSIHITTTLYHRNVTNTYNLHTTTNPWLNFCIYKSSVSPSFKLPFYHLYMYIHTLSPSLDHFQKELSYSPPPFDHLSLTHALLPRFSLTLAS